MYSNFQQFAPAEASTSLENLKTGKAPVAAYKYWPDGVCEFPGCGKPVAGGMVHFNIGGYFCSDYHKRKAYNARWASGLVCERCHGPVPGNNDRTRTPRYCSAECSNLSRSEKQVEGAGPFQEVIEDYLKFGTLHYTESSRAQARVQLGKFFTYAYSTEQLATLDQITPRVVSRYIAAERERGITAPNPVSLVAPFFRWAQDEDLYERLSPVVPRIHCGEKRTRQPYEDTQMKMLCEIVEGSDKTQLKLMFAIGEECGLRNSEVGNIRLSDVNLDNQTIYVRLPTKNKEPRSVPFHNKVKKYLQEWLRERDPLCTLDNLFHSATLKAVNPSVLDSWFKQLFGKHPECRRSDQNPALFLSSRHDRLSERAIQQVLDKWCRRLNLAHVHIHQLRHSFAIPASRASLKSLSP